MPAIAALDVVLLALMLLLLVVAVQPLARLLAALVRRVPVVGGGIANVMTGATDAAVSLLGSAASAAAHGFIDVFVAVGAAIGLSADWGVRAVEQVVDASARVAHRLSVEASYLEWLTVTTAANVAHTAAEEVLSVEQLAEALAHDVTVWTAQQLQTLYQYVVGQIDATVQFAHDQAVAVYRYAQAGLGELAQALQGDIAQVVTWTTASLGAVTAWAERAIGAEAAAREQAVADAVHYAAVAAGDAYTSAVHVVEAEAAAVGDVANPALDQLYADLREWVGTTNPSAAVLGIPIPAVGSPPLLGTLGIVGAVTAVGAEVLRSCAIPTCRDLGRFPHDLHAISSDVLLVLLVALLVEARTHPAAAVADILESVGRDVQQVAGDLLGAL
jgi:hypothetical protein